MFFITLIIKERYEETGKLVIPISNNMMMILLVLFLAHYLIIYLKKRKAKALRMFLEQMSDDDFELLLRVKDSLSFTSKYSPPFVLCNHQLYVFSFFTIKEIDPAKVTEVNWSRGKDSIFVQLKAPQRITLGLPRGGSLNNTQNSNYSNYGHNLHDLVRTLISFSLCAFLLCSNAQK